MADYGDIWLDVSPRQARYLIRRLDPKRDTDVEIICKLNDALREAGHKGVKYEHKGK